MALISQPGSDYQIASISLDAGYTRDLILLLTDVHAVLDHLYLDGTLNRPGFCRGSIERTIGSWQEGLRTRRR